MKYSSIYFLITTATVLGGCATSPEVKAQEQSYLTSATTSLSANKSQQALNATAQALKINDDNYQTYYLQAQAYQQLNDSKNTELNYQKSLQLNDSNTAVIASYGSFLCNNKRYADATIQFDTALQLAKKYSSTNYEQIISSNADCLTNQNKLDQAIESYQFVLASNNKPQQAYLGIAKAYLLQSDYPHAAFYASSYPGVDTVQSLQLKLSSLSGLSKSTNISPPNRSLLNKKIKQIKQQLANLNKIEDYNQQEEASSAASIMVTTDINNQNTTPVRLATVNKSQQRVLPNKPSTQNRSTKPTKPATFASRIHKNQSNGRHYVVIQAGDTLFNVSQKSNISEATLTKLNHLKTQSVPLGTNFYLD